MLIHKLIRFSSIKISGNIARFYKLHSICNNGYEALRMKILQYIKNLSAKVGMIVEIVQIFRFNKIVMQRLIDCADSVPEVVQALERVAYDKMMLKEFEAEMAEFDTLLFRAGRLALNIKDIYPCLSDKTIETAYDRHYIYHPAWAARVIADFNPSRHVDISSALQFGTIISAFVDVDFYDFRPAQLKLSNFTSSAIDLNNLSFDTNSIESLSCMHVIEHIGLGRYGDPFDIDGDRKAANELSRVLAPNGRLILAFPVGRPRIQFNAHRIYSHEQVIELFSGLKLVEHALIPDGRAEDGLIHNPANELIMSQSYGCGCYVFTKQQM